jgi:hypothetical protein
MKVYLTRTYRLSNNKPIILNEDNKYWVEEIIKADEIEHSLVLDYKQLFNCETGHDEVVFTFPRGYVTYTIFEIEI